MSDAYLRLSEPPTYCVSWPECSACQVGLEPYDGWACPSCGTTWPDSANDGDKGALDGDLAGPVVPNDDAWRFSHLTGEARDAAVRQWEASRE